LADNVTTKSETEDTLTNSYASLPESLLATLTASQSFAARVSVKLGKYAVIGLVLVSVSVFVPAAEAAVVVV
jgi:hypothetical protein